MYWETYAYVLNNKIVGIGVYEPTGAYTNANTVAHNLHGYSAFAVCVTNYPVQIGDTYQGGRFYRNGEEIKKLHTVEDDLDDVYAALAELGELIGG